MSTIHGVFAALGLEERLILEEKVILEDGPSGLIKSDLTKGEPNMKEVIVSQSTVVKMRGDILQIHKSTKGAENSKKVSEMRKIWENKKLKQIEIGPGNSANKPFCVKPMGGQKLPTVLDRPTAPNDRD